MKIQRTKNAGRNIISGSILRVYQVIVPFFMRTLMIYQMGLEYAGLNNLFTSIFQVLNLAELGIGAALTFSMYEPIAKDDSTKICALLNLYRKCFNIIGCIIFGLGLLCLPFLKYLVSGAIPTDLNLQFLYLLYLVNTVLSYWLFSYKKSLLYAHQRNDINSKLTLFTSTVQYLLQAFVLLKLHNYYLYVISSILSQILLNISSAFIINRIYPYEAKGTIDSQMLLGLKKRVQGLVTNKIGGVILRSADSIVISAFLGLTVLALYQNYYYILSAVISIVAIIFEACVAGIGNSLVTEKTEKNYEDFCTMTFLTGFLLGICCSCFVCLYQPFMTLWMGKKNLLEFPLIICFVVYFFVYEIDQLISTYKDAAGIWYQDRYRPLVTAIFNLGLNVITVKLLGLYGVLLSTVISIVIVGMPWLLYNIFHTLFIGTSIKRYILLLSKILLSTIIVCVVTGGICFYIPFDGFLGLIICLLISVVLSCSLQLLMLFKCKEFMRAQGLMKNLLWRK